MAVKPNDDFEKYGDLKTFEPDLRQEHSDVIADYLESMGVGCCRFHSCRFGVCS